MLEARCSLGQGSQWGIWPTERGAVWKVSFVLVLYLGTFISGLRVFQERWGRFCSQGLDSWQFSLCRQLLLLPQGPEIAFSTRRWEQSGCKTVCICHSWSVEYSQQPPAGNEPKSCDAAPVRCSSAGKGKTPTSQDPDKAKWGWEVQLQPGCQHIPAWDLGCHFRPINCFSFLCPAHGVLHFQHIL